MAEQAQFSGIPQEGLDFLLQCNFNNNKAWFEEHREQYVSYVQQPLIALEAAISPAVLEVDPRVRCGRRAVSRIYRDTRFSKDKSPLRDHMWIAYRQAELRLSEAFCFYFEINPVGYLCGMGMYDARPAFMQELRAKGTAQPAHLESLLQEKCFAERFTLSGQDYVRPKVEGLPEAVEELLNKRHFTYSYHSEDTAAMAQADFAESLHEDIAIMAPLYRFIHGLEGGQDGK